MQATIQYVSDIAVGAILIVAALCHAGVMAWATFGIGLAMILVAVVGSNVASLIALRRGIVVGEPDGIEASQKP